MSVVLQVVVATFLTPPLNLLTLWDGIATAQLEARLEAMREAGEPTTMGELARLYPDPPEGHNAARFFNAAFERMEERGGVPADRDLPVVGMGDLPGPGEPLPPAMLEAVRWYLADNAETLRLLHRATALDHCKFDIDFERGPPRRFRHHVGMRQAARLFALEAIERTESGRPDEAAESLRACLRLGRALGREPFLVSWLAALATDGLGIEGAARWASRAQPSAKALRRLEEALRATACPKTLERILIADRCSGLDIYQRYFLEPTPEDRAGLIAHLGPRAELIRLVPLAYFKTDMACYIDLTNELVAVARKPYPESLLSGARVGRELGRKIPRACAVCRQILPALVRVFGIAQKYTARAEAARVGLAALRYKARRGRLPETLRALVPDFIEAVPPDPFDGKPLRYRKDKSGCVVYAVGENGRNDWGEVQGLGRAPRDAGFRVRWPGTEF